jgi:predicted esterase
MNASGNPHLAMPPVLAGAGLARAHTVAVLVHGRNQSEQVMLDVVRRLALPGVAYVLPIAAGLSWYPNRYFDPASAVEPHLQPALAAVTAAIEDATAEAGAGARVVLGGFSQGACLLAELVARRAAVQLAGVAILTGSLIGRAEERRTPARVDGLPMFFSCARHDEWVALADAEASAEAFRRAGAQVAFAPLEDREHVISDRAVAGLRALLAGSD